VNRSDSPSRGWSSPRLQVIPRLRNLHVRDKQIVSHELDLVSPVCPSGVSTFSSHSRRIRLRCLRPGYLPGQLPYKTKRVPHPKALRPVLFLKMYWLLALS
jgi:hypothetical protein